MKNILITGGNGYIAKSIYNNLKSKHNITSITRQDFDLSNYNATCKWLNKKYFDVVIHTAITGGSRLQQDNLNVTQQNLAMYNNLHANRHCFKKLISFGSGAEIHHSDTPYANSKRTIADSIQKTENFYNLRIFGVFDENELLTRFIKANISRYIKNEPIIIHENKIMDFFYMTDLINLVNYYINNSERQLQKETNCVYIDKYSLNDVANIINNLSNSKSAINCSNSIELTDYTGKSNLPPIDLVGLHSGIQFTYNALKKL